MGPLNTLAESEKRIGRAFEQAIIQCNFISETLNGCLNATDVRFDDSNGNYDHEKYKNYINNKFLYEEYKVSIRSRLTPITFNQFETGRRGVRTRFSGTIKPRFLLFIHDFANTDDNINGSADSVEEKHNAVTGKWAVIYNNTTANFDTAIHVAAHTMGYSIHLTLMIKKRHNIGSQV